MLLFKSEHEIHFLGGRDNLAVFFKKKAVIWGGVGGGGKKNSR
jgi:hypothetical protein